MHNIKKDLEAAFSISAATTTNILKVMEKEEFTRFRLYLDQLTQNIVDLVEENTK